MPSNQSPTNPDALLSLIERVKENYQEPPPSPPKRGKKRDFSALSFLLLAVVAVTMRTFRDSELRKLLEKDRKLREALGFERVPHRTCIGRRLSGLAPEADWRPNNENEANIAIEALLAGDLKVTDVLLGDETFGGGLFPYLYEEAGGWVLSPKQLPQERRLWKDDLYDYRKETIELLFQQIIRALGLNEWQVKLLGDNLCPFIPNQANGEHSA